MKEDNYSQDQQQNRDRTSVDTNQIQRKSGN
jgi:hypothetical protein